MIRVAAAAALAFVGLTIGADPASAGAGRCLHRDAFREVERTYLAHPPTRQEVHQRFGTRGRSVGFHTRIYRGCVKGSRVWVQFERDGEGTFRATSTAYTGRYFSVGDGEPLHPA